MIRISKLTDYSVLLLTHIAVTEADHPLNAREIAKRVRLPLPTVSKILKILAREGILLSHRGINGGYALSATAEETSVARIISAIEGPIAVTECNVFGTSDCDHQTGCPVEANWKIINRAVAEALDKISLADMMRPALGVEDGNRPGAARGDSNDLLQVTTPNEERE